MQVYPNKKVVSYSHKKSLKTNRNVNVKFCMALAKPNGQKFRYKEDELHGAIGIGNLASFVGRKMVARRMRCTVKVNECVANPILEGMFYGVTTLVPHCAFV